MGEGYTGRVLEVDLGGAALSTQELPEQEWRRYVGGGLMGVRRLLSDTTPGLDPYDPEALLMFWSSVVAGHPYVGLARFAVVAKSPLSGGVGESRVAGPFGQALKSTGFDGVVVRGSASGPTYLLIEHGVASLLDATPLWGMDTGEATDWLQASHGEDAHVAVIGRAGERLVRFASIISDRTHPAARLGLGAVMGSKRLKAVVLVGGTPPRPADPATLERVTETYRSRMSGNVLTRSQFEAPGFGGWLLEGDHTGYAGGVANFTTSELPDLSAATPQALAARMVSGSGACPGCPNECVKVFANGHDDRAGGLDEEALPAFALALGITDLDTILDLNARCHLWGVDPVSLTTTVAFATEAAERGLLPDGELLLSRCRSGAAGVTALLEEVCLGRDRWGLAEGSARVSARLGAEAEPLAMHSKGVEFGPFDPRASAGQALGYAVSPLGPRYEIVEHDIDFDPVDGHPQGLEQMRTLGFGSWEPMEALDDRRVARTHALLEMWSGLDALCISLFASPPVRELRLVDVATLVSAVTGWVTSDHEVFLWGGRRWNLMRVYNLREGIDAAQDRLPPRFHEVPIDSGRHLGSRPRTEEFEHALRLYYDLAGWTRDGVPRTSTLISLGLGWAAPHLPRSAAAEGRPCHLPATGDDPRA